MPSNKKIRIAFFFPDRNIGGGPYWLIRMADLLSKDNHYEVFYIDYSDGYSHKIAPKKTKVKFIDFVDNSNKLLINDDVILFAPIYHMHNMPKVTMNSKVLFFNWHELCMPVLKNSAKFEDKQLHDFIKMVSDSDAEVFCDESHFLAQEEYVHLFTKRKFVPVHVLHKTICAKKTLVKNNEINIAILGRLVDDKIQSVNNVIENLDLIKTDKNINVHIIGDGPCFEKIVKPKNKNITINKVGIVTGEKLDKYLGTKVDILFAMGTSVLEGAAIGLPSVVISNDSTIKDHDDFCYVFDMVNYSCGFTHNNKNKVLKHPRTIQNILNDIYMDNKKHEIGTKCCDFVQNNNSVENSTNLLKKYLNETKLSFSKVYNWCLRVKELKRQKKYVVRLFNFIPLFGINKIAKVCYIKLFNKIPFIKIIFDADAIKIKLFGILLLLKIKKS